MSIFEGKKLIKKDGTSVDDASTVTEGVKVILVYFSAHWCPPCRGFTPVLKDFYENVKNESVCIIFVSSDRSSDDMDSYFKNDHGDYYAVPHGGELGVALKKNCDVNGIPMLCVVDKNGKKKDGGGRQKVVDCKSAADCVAAVREWAK